MGVGGRIGESASESVTEFLVDDVHKLLAPEVAIQVGAEKLKSLSRAVL